MQGNQYAPTCEGRQRVTDGTGMSCQRWYRVACAVSFASSIALIAVSLVGVVANVSDERATAQYVSAFMAFAEGILCLCAGSLCATAGYHREGGRSLGALPRSVRRGSSPVLRIAAVAACLLMGLVHVILMACGLAAPWVLPIVYASAVLLLMLWAVPVFRT